jgi:hypothetical protein
MEIKFKVDGDRYLDNVDWDLQKAMRTGMTDDDSRRLCAIFLVDEAGEYMPTEAADKILGKLTIRQVMSAQEALSAEIMRLSGGEQTPLAHPTSTPS